ncbi:hypothetical protein CJU89_1385 [Yarrowia sp. B02]|nr:hypothetical protein CJU89_1385 [Yarrowia sp. B02]
MDIFPRELRRCVLQLLDLESLIALRQTNKFYYTCLDEFDDSLIRDKVLQRAPWFQKDSGIDNWNACARVLVNRTNACLAGRDSETEWFIFNDFEAAMRLEPERTLVKPDDFPSKFCKSSQLLFPDEYLKSPSSWHHKGTNVCVRGMQLDLTTLLSGPSDYSPEDLPKYDVYPYSCPEVVTPSSLKLRSHDGVNRIQVAAENDNLLLVRVQTCPDEDDPYEDEDDEVNPGGNLWTFVLDDENHIVHKASCERDDDGVLIIDPKKLVKIDLPVLHGMAHFKLLPGAGGALVTKYHTGDAECYLAARPDNFILYNGFLYFYLEGRLFRLWVDLGVQKPIPRAWVPLNRHLPQKYDSQCLTAAHGLFPAIGTFCEQTRIMHQADVLLQGSREHGLERYVTVQRAGGYVVGDLKTGHTWRVDLFDSDLHMVIHWIDGDKVKFYKLDKFVVWGLHEVMERRKGDKHAHFAKVFHTLVTDSAVQEKDTGKLIERPLYYSVSGKATGIDEMYAEPEEYTKLDGIVPDWEVTDDEEEYDSEEEHDALVEAYNEESDRDIYLAQRSMRAEKWYQIFEELHKVHGSEVTNDPEDPENVDARREFLKGAAMSLIPGVPCPPMHKSAQWFGFKVGQAGLEEVGEGPPEEIGMSI